MRRRLRFDWFARPLQSLRAFAAIVLPLVTCVVSCDHAGASNLPEAPGLNAKRYANLQKRGGEALSCAPETLTHTYLGDNLHRMQGCGKVEDFYLYCPGTGMCVWMTGPVKQAEFDLDCPREQLTSVALAKHEFGVTGCERRIRYFVRCVDVINCSWFANVVSNRAGERARAAGTAAIPDAADDSTSDRAGDATTEPDASEGSSPK